MCCYPLRHFLVSAAILGLATLVGACGAAATPAPGPTVGPTSVALAATPTAGMPTVASLEKVRLGVLSSVSDSGFWIALAKGYFQEQGLDVETQQFGAAAEMIAPLGAGLLDVGGGAPGVGLANAVLRGVDIRIVADKGSTRPGHGFEAILARKDLYDSGEIRGPADLKGRKYAVSTVTGITLEAAFNRYMKQAGLSARDADLVQMPFPDMVAAFANKSVEAGSVIEPFVTQIVENGDAAILVREDTLYPDHAIAVVLYSGLFIQDKPEAARRFMVAYLKAVREYNDAFVKKDPARYREMVEILTKSTPVKDPALYEKMAMPGLNPDGETNVSSLKEDQEYFIAAGLQQERVDMERVVDHSFVRYAVAQLGGPYR